jgi:hypothetical protein
MITSAMNWNVTTSSIDNSIGSGGLLTIAVILIAAVALTLLITNIERYTKFFNAIEKLIKSVKYAIYGSGVVASGYVLYLVCGVITTVGKGFDPIIIAYIVGGYVVLVLVGYAAEVVFKKAKAMHSKYKELKSLEIPAST